MTDLSAYDIVATYIEALTQRDNTQMDTLRTPDFILDFVYADAFEDRPLTDEQTRQFWPAWFVGFPEMDFKVTRAIAASEVVVVQWTFTGTHAGSLGAPIFESPLAATGRTVQFRGVSVYDVQDGLIQRETAYMDLATLIVELGVEL
ncbi:ester cyclase [Chloroflexi bacterium TSY]|nr:ester cyclase [Chloroflexi bacterium TSY]